jgi:hypothetical protein
MTRQRPISDEIRRPGDGVGLEAATATLSGLHAKRRLLLLCARIGYSPHASL